MEKRLDPGTRIEFTTAGVLRTGVVVEHVENRGYLIQEDSVYISGSRTRQRVASRWPRLTFEENPKYGYIIRVL